ncbi:hypothetical protein Fmac_007016 [Flemingia macrophylla]|uniref:Uncharacterized protein n=1 Tax=Flemingia macrophylla TaxID=520843 RepID=A0ABD1NC97_9FABA
MFVRPLTFTNESTERKRRTQFIASQISTPFSLSLESSFLVSSIPLPSSFCLRFASMLNWSLISLLDLMAFLYIQTASRKGEKLTLVLVMYSEILLLRIRVQQSLISWSVLILSSLTLLSHAVFHIVLAIEGVQWTTADAQWAQLIGFVRVQSWRTFPREYFLVTQVLATFLSIFEIYGHGFRHDQWRDFHSGHLCSSVLLTGSHLKGVCCLLLPAVQLIVGISHVSSELAEMENITSTRESDLTEQLLPQNHSHFVQESRSDLRHINFLLQGAVSQSFSINFLAYGFPMVFRCNIKLENNAQRGVDLLPTDSILVRNNLDLFDQMIFSPKSRIVLQVRVVSRSKEA